jgi:hypothetical protein
MSGFNLRFIKPSTLLAAIFSNGVYPRTGGNATDTTNDTFTPPAGFERLTGEKIGFTATPGSGYAAETFVNRQTGQVFIVNRGSDGIGEAIGIADGGARAGLLHPQFEDGLRYASAAKAAAQSELDKYREDNQLPKVGAVTSPTQATA